AKGLCERIGIDGRLTHKVPAKDAKYEFDIPMPTHAEAIQAVLDALLSSEHGVIKSASEIDAVGHRVVHGGEKFASSVRITGDVMAALEECIPLAPLHNPANITGIQACEKVMPGVPMVAVFDTAFHQTMPAKSYIYALPYEFYENDKVRRYGFHGTSHRYVSARAAAMLGKPIEEVKIITCHLGNGSSVAAVDCGKSVDTSMGFTPLAGVPMGTRSGDLDAGILEYLMNKHGYDMKEMMNILNKKSGVLGISGVSSDFRDIENAANDGNQRAALALEAFQYSVKKLVGAYAAAMGGVDAIVFTAGVGENDANTRMNIASGLEFMGVKMDAAANNVRGKETVISAADSKVKVLLIPTDEELMIAQDTAAIVKG
uniref:acetate/propionate family kinase n=1 Tax=uncultured Flavonifractor sp. TaxID=1193534 RepID=UPI0025F3B6D3